MRYRTAIPVLMLGGVFFFIFHSRFVVGTWAWQLPYAPLILAEYAIVGVWNWLIGSLVLTLVFRWFGKTVPNAAQIDIAVFYLWLTWALMPLLDVVHLFGMPTRPLVQALPWRHFLLGHFSLWLTAPVRAVLLYFVLRGLGALGRGRAVVLATVLSFGARFVVEPSGALIFILFQQLGIHWNFWVGQHSIIACTLLGFVFWRLTLEHQPWRHAVAHTALVGMVVAAVTVAAWESSWAALLPGPRPAPDILPDVAPATAVRDVRHPGRAIWTWEPSQAEGGVLHRLGPFLDGMPHRQTVTFSLDSMKAMMRPDVRGLTCELEANVQDNHPGDASPWVGCDLGLAPQSNRLAAPPQVAQGVHGAVRYRRHWSASDPDWSRILDMLRSGQGHVDAALGVRGGGDYTQPDRLELLSVQVTVTYGPEND